MSIIHDPKVLQNNVFNDPAFVISTLAKQVFPRYEAPKQKKPKMGESQRWSEEKNSPVESQISRAKIDENTLLDDQLNNKIVNKGKF